MDLYDALVILKQEDDTERLAATAEAEMRIREQWMTAIHAHITALFDDAEMDGRHEKVVKISADGSYADVILDGVRLRWWADQNRARGQWYARPRTAVVKQCPNPDCVWPDGVVSDWYDDVIELADRALSPLRPHYNNGRCCNGVTADPIPEPVAQPNKVIVLRESETFADDLAALLERGYRWTPCCTDAEGRITVVAVHR